MACDAQSLETLSGIDGLARLSEHDQLLALAAVYGSSLTAQQAIVLAASDKLASLSDRDLDEVLLAILCVGGGSCVAPDAPVLSFVSFVFQGANMTWTEAADPSLDFLIQWSKVAGGPYPNQQSFAGTLRAGTLSYINFFPPGSNYAIIQARNSPTCVSSNSNEVNF